jgi:hypothetical protein
MNEGLIFAATKVQMLPSCLLIEVVSGFETRRCVRQVGAFRQTMFHSGSYWSVSVTVQNKQRSSSGTQDVEEVFVLLWVCTEFIGS